MFFLLIEHVSFLIFFVVDLIMKMLRTNVFFFRSFRQGRYLKYSLAWLPCRSLYSLRISRAINSSIQGVEIFIRKEKKKPKIGCVKSNQL